MSVPLNGPAQFFTMLSVLRKGVFSCFLYFLIWKFEMNRKVITSENSTFFF